MAEENIDINIKIQLKEANAELIRARDNFGDLSKEALAAAQKVGTLKEKIGDARQQADAFTDGGKFKAVTGVLTGVAGGFSAIQGAIGLVSKDSKALQETMLKVQSAMALTQGLTAISEMGDSFKNLGTAAKAALSGIKTGIAATGIGLLVVALGLVVANWKEIKKAVQDAIPALRSTEEVFYKIKEVAMGVANVVFNLFKNIGESVMKLVKGDFKGAFKELKEGLEIAAAYEEGVANQKVANQADRDKTALEKYIKTKEDELEVLKAAGKDTYALEMKILRNKQKLYKDDKEELAKVNQEIKVLQATHKKDLADAAAADAAAQKKAAQELWDDLLKQQEEEQKIVDAEKERLRRLSKTEKEKELSDLEKQYEAKKKLFAEGSWEMEALDKEYKEKVTAVNKKYNDKELDQEQKKIDKKYVLLKQQAELTITDKEKLNEKILELELQQLEEELALKELYGEKDVELENKIALKKKEITDKTADDKKKKAKETEDKIFEIAEASLGQMASISSALSDLTTARLNKDLAAAGDDENKKEELRKSAFEKQKKFDKANAVIAGIAAAIQSYKAGAALGGPPVGALFALISGAATAAQIKKIDSVPYPESKKEDKKDGSGGSKFAKGGLLKGPSHQFGGIKTKFGELEGGEFVINKDSTAKNLDLLKSINNSSIALDLFSNPFVNKRFEMTERIMNQLNQRTPDTQPIKAYVVASEMSSQQEANKRVNDLAKL